MLFVFEELLVFFSVPLPKNGNCDLLIIINNIWHEPLPHLQEQSPATINAEMLAWYVYQMCSW